MLLWSIQHSRKELSQMKFTFTEKKMESSEDLRAY